MVGVLFRAIFYVAVVCVFCTASASQNEFFSDSYYPVVGVPARSVEDTSEVVRTAALEVPPTPPSPKVSNPLSVIFKFPGETWSKRTAKDYGLQNFKKMAVTPDWEKNPHKDWKHLGASFTQYTAFILEHYGNNLINGPNEFTRANKVCPKYNSLSRSQKVEFWVHMIAAITKRESGYNPKDRMRESTFAKPDNVTREPVYSEGLLQLSYSDMKTYPKECGNVFNWEKDKRIARDSQQKTIFDPMRNLYCGIRILDHISAKRRSIIFDNNHYWSVLKPNGRYGKVPAILKDVQTKNPACR